MTPTELLRYLVAGTIVVLILALLVTQLLGQPFVVFVETGSMEPTLQPNDGFVAIPAFLAGEPEEGDVILFESQQLGGGELTTHRVVRETDRGYITKGDANPFTDQDGDEPPVAEGQVKSVGLQVDGSLVVVPGLGASVTSITSAVDSFQAWLFGLFGLRPPGVTTFSTGILVLGLVLFVYSTATGGGNEARTRSTGGLLRNAVLVIAVLTLVVIVPVNFSMLLPSGVYQIEVVSAVQPTDDQRVIRAGESGEVTYFMQNSGHLPVVVFLQPASDGVETPDGYTYVPRRTTVNQSVTLRAPDETGTVLRFVREYRYLVLLPPSLIALLHGVTPLLAILAINVTVASVVVLVSLATIGAGRVRVRSRRRDVAIEDRLRRRLPPLSLGRDLPSRPGGTRDPVYNWVNRRERAGSERKPASGPRPPSSPGVGPETGPEPDPADGSPPDHLDGRQLIELYDTLQNPPDAVGIEATRWTPDLLREYLLDAYGVAYSPAECARLLERAGYEPDT